MLYLCTPEKVTNLKVYIDSLKDEEEEEMEGGRRETGRGKRKKKMILETCLLQCPSFSNFSKILECI